jgi:hypothetical protein
MKEARDIFIGNESRNVASFPSTLLDILSIGDDGLKAEMKVFAAVKEAAEEVAERRSDLKFCLFHSVKYGTTGDGTGAKWESDIDVVLVCLNTVTGWFYLSCKVPIRRTV